MLFTLKLNIYLIFPQYRMCMCARVCIYIYPCVNICEYSACQFLEEALKQADTNVNVSKVLNIHSKT